MSHFQQHQEFYDTAIHLSEEEKKDPTRVMEDFFTDYRLSEVRQLNRDMDEICLSTDKAPFEDPDQRDFLLAYRWREEKLLESAWVLSQTKPLDAKPGKTDDPNWNRKVNIAKLLNLDNIQQRVSEIELELIDYVAVIVKASGELLRADCKIIGESLGKVKVYSPASGPALDGSALKREQTFVFLDLHDLSSRGLELQSKVTKLSGIVLQAWYERMKLKFS